MAVTIQGVPESISQEALTAWLAQVGIEAASVRTVTIDRTGIRAEVAARNADGEKYARGDRIATHVVQIRIDDDWPAVTTGFAETGGFTG